MARKKKLYRWEEKAKNNIEEQLLHEDFRSDLERFRSNWKQLPPERLRREIHKFLGRWKLPTSTIILFEHYLKTGEWDWQLTWPPARIISTEDESVFPSSGDEKADWAYYKFLMEERWTPAGLKPPADPFTGVREYLAIEITFDATAKELKEFIDANADRLKLTKSRSKKKRNPKLDSLIHNMNLDGKSTDEILEEAEKHTDEPLTKEDIRRKIRRGNEGTRTNLGEWGTKKDDN